MMIAWMILASLFCNSAQDGNSKEDGAFPCEPDGMTVRTLNQNILLTWEDKPSCNPLNDELTYELEVFIADKQIHREEVAVSPDQIGSTHYWNWTSHLALECATHTLRLSSRYKNQSSQWKHHTIPGHKALDWPEVFPRDKVFQLGSQATFCCVLPTGESLEKLYLSGNSSANQNISQIGSHAYALTVDLNRASSASCTDVKCETKTSDNGACAYIGYPPADRDLSCETQDLQTVECQWTVGRNTHLAIASPTTYQLLGSVCAEGFKGRCSHTMQVEAGEHLWTVTAQNQLGTITLTYEADLTKREGVKVSEVGARNVSLEWEWSVQTYNHLNITCQLNISHGDAQNSTSESVGVGLTSAILKDLIPNWTYRLKIRCSTTQHFWKWSEWSLRVKFRTLGDVPDALDVWTQVKDKKSVITWKVPLAHQSHGDIIDYVIRWAPTKTPDRQEKSSVTHPKNSFALGLNSKEEYAVSVTARNSNGSSSPSSVTIPILNPGGGVIKSSRILGSNGGFNLSWSPSPSASCGFIVDWRPFVGTSGVDWLRIPPTETNVNIHSKSLGEGVRYLLSVHACTQGAPVLLERREGYIKEKIIPDGLFKPFTWTQRNLDVEVTWNRVSLQKQPAFIQGYVLYWVDNNNIVMNISTDNPQATSLTARNLQISSYSFTLKAKTAVGECGATHVTAILNSPTDNLISAICITLVTLLVFLLLFVVFCCRHWECIKLELYPPIPKPVLKEKWTASLKSCRPVFMEMSHHEIELMTIPKLHCKSEVSAETDCVDQGHVGTTNRVEALSIPSTAMTCQTSPSASSSLAITTSLNSSYNLMLTNGVQQPISGPGSQETHSLVTRSNGYHPQRNTVHPEDAPESLLPCVFTYILLPRSASTE
ncbi:leukemia inhibitory factor receptor-like isoform X2 [Entelurus aequoreus]|uniref:leukemia inhibitory factor receptor-like isoform X2 n=1 Tax=Entelurus aequoreus TaxID=161455 RepID=UPI002B1D12D1|nr:leukemia inhibitory factor receptor-like isoform X2 [Entelurus aequoreus]